MEMTRRVERIRADTGGMAGLAGGGRIEWAGTFHAAHVKDVVGILRWAENPRDRMAGFRTLQLLPGVGPATARKALDHMEAAGFAAAALEGFRAPTAAADWPSLGRLMALLWGAAVDLAAQMDLVRQWYGPQVERLYDAAPSRLSDLEQLERLAGRYVSRRAFLEELTLDPPEATGDEAGPPTAWRGPRACWATPRPA